MHLLIHGFDPSWILGCFGKCFWLAYCHPLHHEAIVICHTVVVAESANRILLSGGATELLICLDEGFLGSDWYVEAVELTVE